MKNLIFTLCLLLGVSASAAQMLPPFYHNAEEIIAILDSPKVAALFGSEKSISSIFKNRDGYTVASGRCSMKVVVTREIVGPESVIKLNPKTLRCRDDKVEDIRETAKKEICKVAVEEYPKYITMDDCLSEKVKSELGGYTIDILVCGDVGELVTFLYEDGDVSYGSSGASDSCED